VKRSTVRAITRACRSGPRDVAAHDRAPRFLPAWQRRIAAFFQRKQDQYNG
jgi:hypothetical protein